MKAKTVMLTGLWLFLATTACVHRTSAPPPSGGTTGKDVTGLDVRLGCVTIPAAEVLAEARRWSANGDGGGSGWESALKQARERLARRAIARREAERLHLEVSPEEVERAIGEQIAVNGLDRATFERWLAEQGMTEEEFRAEVAQRILDRKILLARRLPLRVTEKEVQAEMERPSAEPGATANPAALSRAAASNRLVAERMQKAMDTFYSSMRQRLAQVATREENGICVEQWPEYAAEQIRFTGMAGMREEWLQEAIRQVLGPQARMPVDVDIHPALRVSIIAACLDHGFLDAEVEVQEVAQDHLTLFIREGDLYRLRSVRLVIRDPAGQETALAIEQQAWKPLLSLRPGDVFVRTAFGRFLEALREYLARHWSVDPMSITVSPEIDQRDGWVDAVVVILRTGGPYNRLDPGKARQAAGREGARCGAG